MANRESHRNRPEVAPDQPEVAPAQAVPAQGHGINERALFMLVLLLSICYNSYVSYSKPEASLSTSGSVDELIQEQTSGLQAKLDKALDEVENYKKEVKNYKKDQKMLYDMFALQQIVGKAIESEPKIEFQSNEKDTPKIIEIIKQVISDPPFPCRRDIPANTYDTYKNCFRELAIDVHNGLDKLQKDDTQYVVSAGRVHYSFMITTTRSRREEFFITFGDILFEILKFEKTIQSEHVEEEVSQESINKMMGWDKLGNETQPEVDSKPEVNDSSSKPEVEDQAAIPEVGKKPEVKDQAAIPEVKPEVQEEEEEEDEGYDGEIDDSEVDPEWGVEVPEVEMNEQLEKVKAEVNKILKEAEKLSKNFAGKVPEKAFEKVPEKPSKKSKEL